MYSERQELDALRVQRSVLMLLKQRGELEAEDRLALGETERRIAQLEGGKEGARAKSIVHKI